MLKTMKLMIKNDFINIYILSLKLKLIINGHITIVIRTKIILIKSYMILNVELGYIIGIFLFVYLKKILKFWRTFRGYFLNQFDSIYSSLNLLFSLFSSFWLINNVFKFKDRLFLKKKL